MGPPGLDEEQFAHLPDRLEVRELQDRDQSKGFRVQPIPLVTTLLEATGYSVEAFAQLDDARGGSETKFAHGPPPGASMCGSAKRWTRASKSASSSP